MKKGLRILYSLLVLIFCNVSYSLAEDGALKIDTDIATNNTQKKDKSYVEQETELSKLFDISLSEKISTMKEKESLSNNNDKALIFSYTDKGENLANQYQKELFLPQNKEIKVEKVGASLNQNTESIGLVTILIVLVAAIIMIWTLITRKKGI